MGRTQDHGRRHSGRGLLEQLRSSEFSLWLRVGKGGGRDLQPRRLLRTILLGEWVDVRQGIPAEIRVGDKLERKSAHARAVVEERV